MAAKLNRRAAPAHSSVPTTRRAAWQVTRAVVVVGALVWALVPGGADARVAQTGEPVEPEVELTGTGTWTAAGPALSWANAFYEAPTPVRVGYLAEGTADARRAFVDGDDDFLISGTPFSADEREALRTNKRDLIDLPIQAVGLAFILSAPYPTGLQLCRPGPSEDDPTMIDCYPEGRFEGPLRLYPEDVGDVLLETGRNNWANPRFQDLMPAGLDMIVPLAGALPVVRSDGGATNKFLQQYLSVAAEDKWRAKLAAEGLDDYEPQEKWPFIQTPSRSGLPTVTQLVASGQAPSSSSTVIGGVMAPTSPLYAAAAIETERAKPEGTRRTELWIPQLLNGAGEWVSPTPDAITAAIAAGEGAPLHGLSEAVPAAWPLSWVNRMYVPASGLSGDEANALANLIRWQVTVGSTGATILGDGKLTDKLTGEALRKADEVVESNCTAAGLTHSRSDRPGAFAPPGSLTGLGPVSVCDTGRPEPRPTTAPSADAPAPEAPLTAVGEEFTYSPDYAADFVPMDDFGRELLPIYDTTPEALGAVPAATAAPPADTASVVAAETVAALGAMPMPLPGRELGQLDRLATLALGAAAYLAAQSVWRRRRPVAT